MRGLVSRFLHARGGNLATMAALVSPLFLAVAAFCVDTSSLFLERRQLQSMADFAAVAGAASLSQANDAVLRQLRANGLDPVLMTGAYDPSVVNGKTDNKTRVWVEKGNYFPDKNRAVENRFVAGGTSPDAVRVRLARPGNLYFGQAFINRPALGATGMAATKAEAAFWIGSRLLSLNTKESALNGLLGGLLNTDINLKLVDYNALAATDINLLGFLDKLALSPKVNLKAGTYQQLLDTAVSVGDVANVMAQVITNNPTAKAALELLGKNAAALSTKLPLGKLLGLGSLADVSLQSGAGYNITANALQVISAAIVLGGDHQISLKVPINLVVANVAVDVAIGEPAQKTPFFRVGAAGSLVRTAQIRLRLNISVLGDNALGLNSLASVNLPIFIDVASAEGELVNISCPSGPQSANVGIGVRTGIVGIYLGNLDTGFGDFSKKPSVSRKEIASILGLDVLGLIKIKLASIYARAEIPLGDNQQRIVNFSASDITSKKIQTVHSSKLLTSLTSALLNNIEITASVDLLGLNLNITGVVKALGGLLGPLSAPLDSLLFGLLDLLGVKLGEADVQVTGVLCQRAALTQ
ncbi:TadG family pilus assembly protein [Brucella tritici]|uniref:TadG family pilus assembly protein n=1 Tax=Brucella tritici TaxID=94626 RepID=UPI0015907653|nr:TadG family pilus assembly protein [Brucella tritici]